jgi:hypothetical protein
MTHTFHVGISCGSVCSDEEKLMGVLPQSQVNDGGSGTHKGRKSGFLELPHSVRNQWYALAFGNRFFNDASPWLSTNMPNQTNS